MQTLDLAIVCTFCTNICTNQRSLILKSPNLPQNHDPKMSLPGMDAHFCINRADNIAATLLL